MVYQLCATFAKNADLAQNASIRANMMQDLTKSLILVDLTLVESDATISGLPFCEGIVYLVACICSAEIKNAR